MSDYTEIKTQLEEKLKHLVARVEEIDADLSEQPDEDWEDRATESEGDEVKLSVGNLSLGEIEQIRHALHQIDTGSYGTCTGCGTAIPTERLELLPYATTCTQCA
jgi:DnaK suppressor protein